MCRCLKEWRLKLIKIAIVDDDINYMEQLCNYTKRYAMEKNEIIEIKKFSDGIKIVDDYKANYDIIFMDIQMKILDGMKTAQSIRKLDDNVIIIFITNMAQYAIQGYSVNAMDYVLKPLSYFAFSEELSKAIRRIKERTNEYLTIKQESGMIRLAISDILYFESHGHRIFLHSKTGTYEFVETMKRIEEKMKKYQFSRCNNCYIVNLRYVENVKQNEVSVAGEYLQISRPKKKVFMETLTDFVGGEVV